MILDNNQNNLLLILLCQFKGMVISIKIQKNKISKQQLIYLVSGFIIGNSLILPPGSDLKNRAWIALFIGFIEGLIFIWIYTIIPKKFNNKNFHDVLTQVFGNVVGKILFFLFILYCLHLGSFVVRDFMDFISITIMLSTPLIAIGLAVLSVCVYAAYKGILVISRNCQILVPLTFISVAITVILLLKDMKLIYFRPFFDVDLKQLLKSSHDAASFPFGDVVVFLLIFPLVRDKKDNRISTIKGASYGGLVILIVILRNIAVLGYRIGEATYPSAQAVRLINIANVITRLEVIIFFNLITMGFIKISILLWCTAKGFTNLFNLKNYKLLIIPLAICMLLIATYQFESVMDSVKFSTEIYPTFRTFFQVGIPVLTLVVGKVRKLI